MEQERASMRHDFVIRDLVISLPRESGGGAGGTFIPADDGDPLPFWLSPVAAVLVKGSVLEAVRAVITDALEQQLDVGQIARSFNDGDPDGNPAIQQAIHDIGSAVVASVAYTAVGSAIGYPDPDCGGSSLETIPPTITPIVHAGIEIHRVSVLPKLRAQLNEAVATLDRFADRLAPQGDEVGVVAKHLEMAQSALNGR